MRVAAPVLDRLGGANFSRKSLNKIFPRHWSFLLGEVALYSFVVLVGTGIYLTLFFVASDDTTVYSGPYAPLAGQTISEAYASTLRLSFEVRAGLLVRQVHHWAALLFIASIMVHMMRIYFTGAFRKPREGNWVIGMTMFVLAIALGFTGYSLPGDLLSGTGLRIAYSVAESIPFVGTWVVFLVFGGEWPVDGFTSRMYPVHILVLPLAMFGLLAGHLAMLWRQKHTQMTGAGARENNIIGERLWPVYAMKAGGLFLLVVGGLFSMGSLFQINPVWLYGFYEPASVSTAAQPDWYVGFLEGSLRLMPGWQFTIFGVTVPPLFWSGVVLPAVGFLLLYAVPWIHRVLTGDDEEHHLSERPRDAPVRTGLGVGMIFAYVILFLAGAQDVLASFTTASVDELRNIFRASFLLGPPVVTYLTIRICRALQSNDVHPQRNPVGAVLARTSDGGYVDVTDHDVSDAAVSDRHVVEEHARNSGDARETEVSRT